MVEHIFAKPVTFEGKEYASIKMDLDSLTGRDISSIKSRWAQSGKFSPVPAADMDFCAMVACHAGGQPQEFADALPAKDYIGMCQKVSNFLLT